MDKKLAASRPQTTDCELELLNKNMNREETTRRNEPNFALHVATKTLPSRRILPRLHVRKVMELSRYLTRTPLGKLLLDISASCPFVG